ncbi:hypothetical protein D3C86_1806610 [compost metagenome]
MADALQRNHWQGDIDLVNPARLRLFDQVNHRPLIRAGDFFRQFAQPRRFTFVIEGQFQLNVRILFAQRHFCRQAVVGDANNGHPNSFFGGKFKNGQTHGIQKNDRRSVPERRRGNKADIHCAQIAAGMQFSNQNAHQPDKQDG